MTPAPAPADLTALLGQLTPDELARLRADLDDAGRLALAAAAEDAERALARKDFRAFCLRYLGRYFTSPPAEQHPKLFRTLQAIGDGTLRDERGYPLRRAAIALPRKWAKSTIVVLAFPLWCAVTGRRHFILLVSDTDGQALDRSRDIRDELEENELLRADFGALAPELTEGGHVRSGRRRWTEHDFTLSNGVRIKAAGAGQKLRGLRKRERRPDLVLCDDLENDEHVETREQRNKYRRWFTRTLIPLLDAVGASLLVVGTILHHDSLLARLTSAEHFTSFWKWVSACMDPPGDFDHGRSLWPERFPLRRGPDTPDDLDTLEQMRNEDMGPHAFATEMLNEPVDDDTTYIKGPWLEVAKARGVMQAFVRTPEEAAARCWYVASAWDFGLLPDPKAAEERDSDWTVGLAGGLDENDHIVLLRGFRDRGLTPSEVRAVALAEAAVVRPRVVGVDDNSFGKLHEWELNRSGGWPVEPIGSAIGAKKNHLIDGIPGLALLFESGKVVLPYAADRATREIVDVLCDELHGWPKEPHDDAAVAFWYLVSMLRRQVGRRNAHADDTNRRGLKTGTSVRKMRF